MDGRKSTDNLEVFTQCFSVTPFVAGAAALFGGLTWGPRFGLGVFIAAMWSLLGLAILRRLILVLVHPQWTVAKKGWMGFLLLALKFPVLYAGGYLVLVGGWFPLASLLMGLSLWMVAFLGSALRRAAVAASVVLMLVPNGFATEASAGHGSEVATAGHASGLDLPELPNAVTLLSRLFHGQPLGDFLHHWETSLFTCILLGFLIGVAWLSKSRQGRFPSRFQSVMELIVEGFNNFVCGIIGPDGRKFIPFLGTLFLYIWMSNLAGLIPLFKSPTTGFRSVSGFPIPMIPITTIPLALAVFGYVQWTALRHLGPLGYLDHLAGQPRNPFTLALSPLMIVLHVLGEVVTKPLSLSYRLFGNISSEDAVVAVLVGMGFAFLWVEFPILWLALILSTVQAVVFTLLSTIYIAMVLPHKEEDHPDEKGVTTDAVSHA